MLEEVACVESLTVHPGVRQHAVHMFVMYYRPEYCGDLLLPDFLKVVQAEHVPIHRAYASTMANQPAMQKLMANRPDYLRLMPTPVAERAAKEIICIPQAVFSRAPDLRLERCKVSFGRNLVPDGIARRACCRILH
jgi:hypothetical protein